MIDGGLVDVIRWWKQVEEFETLTTQKIGEEVKSAMLMKLAPQQMHMHLHLNAARLKTYEAEKGEIGFFALAVEPAEPLPWTSGQCTVATARARKANKKALQRRVKSRRAKERHF